METYSDSDGVFFFNKIAPSGYNPLLFSKSAPNKPTVIMFLIMKVNIDNLKLIYKIQINSHPLTKCS